MELWDLNDFVCYLELGELLVQSILCAHKIPKHLEKNVEHHQMKCGIIVTLILWGNLFIMQNPYQVRRSVIIQEHM